jgi:predicted GNAT superfamily acetyltransferase
MSRPPPVSIRTLSEMSDLHRLVELLDEVWSTHGSPPVGAEHLRALAYSGNYVSAAYDGDVMLGGSVAFFAAPARRALHSDVVGVRSQARDRRVGFALKLHQRTWALDHGVETMTWTFDPLMSRNAHLNITRLGAWSSTYLTDFYADMPDAINQGQGSDRLLASWQLTSPDVVAACAGSRAATPESVAGIPVLLAESDGGPLEHPVEPAAPQVRVAIPTDIDALRRRDPELARSWRRAVRRSMGAELAAGGQVVGFDRGVGYVISRSAGHADHRR